MENNVFQCPATIQGVRTLIDQGVKLDVVTQELGPEDLTQLFTLKGKTGWFVMKLSEVKPEDLVDLPDEPVEFKGGKTPSQRLHNVMFLYWRDHTSQKIPFETWRLNAMEEIISKYKEKLD